MKYNKCFYCEKEYANNYEALKCENRCQTRLHMIWQMQDLVNKLNGIRHNFILTYGNDDQELACKELASICTETEMELENIVETQGSRIEYFATQLDKMRGDSWVEAPQSNDCRTESELYRSSVGE